jgi:hypothetical protein
MKILSIRHDFLEKELEKNGIAVIPFSFPRGKRGDPQVAKKFVDFAAAQQADVFWFWKDPHLTRELLLQLQQACPRTKQIMWWGDQRGYVIPPLIASRKGLLHALFMTNDDELERRMFQDYGIKHVPTMYHSFSTEEFQLWDTPITHEVFFGGSNFKGIKFPLSRYRTELIHAVRGSCKLVVHGNGWKFPTEKWILRPDYAKALRKANMNLGINHYDITRYYNRRLFESVASGRLHLTYYIPGMEKHFKNGNQLVWFTNIDQCVRQIRFYLNKPEKREEVATRGRSFFIRYHSWPARAKQFIQALNAIL